MNGVPQVSGSTGYLSPSEPASQIECNSISGVIGVIVSRILTLVYAENKEGVLSNKARYTVVAFGTVTALALAYYIYLIARKVNNEPQIKLVVVEPETQGFEFIHSVSPYNNEFPLIPWTDDLYSRVYASFKDSQRYMPPSRTGNFEPFRVQGTPYHALGPCWWVNANKPMAAFIDKLTNFDLVVNLIANIPGERKHSYIDNVMFNLEYPLFLQEYEHCVAYSSADGLRKVLHITNWVDGSLDIQLVGTYIPQVKKVVEALQNNQRVFIHCLAALHRTPVFIVMCQLMMCKAKFVKMNNDEARGFIIGMLREISNSAYDRFPNEYQLAVMLGGKFINLMRESCQT